MEIGWCRGQHAVCCADGVPEISQPPAPPPSCSEYVIAQSVQVCPATTPLSGGCVLVNVTDARPLPSPFTVTPVTVTSWSIVPPVLSANCENGFFACRLGVNWFHAVW